MARGWPLDFTAWKQGHADSTKCCSFSVGRTTSVKGMHIQNTFQFTARKQAFHPCSKHKVLQLLNWSDSICERNGYPKVCPFHSRMLPDLLSQTSGLCVLLKIPASAVLHVFLVKNARAIFICFFKIQAQSSGISHFCPPLYSAYACYVYKWKIAIRVYSILYYYSV